VTELVVDGLEEASLVGASDILRVVSGLGCGVCGCYRSGCEGEHGEVGAAVSDGQSYEWVLIGVLTEELDECAQAAALVDAGGDEVGLELAGYDGNGVFDPGC
jgi:hypothetical protein